MDQKKYSNRYYAHYLKVSTQKEMIQWLLRRETALISPVFCQLPEDFQNCQRYLRVHMEAIIKKIHLFKCSKNVIPYNWYYSLATYKEGIPFRNFLIPLAEKRKWITEHWRDMIAYDFAIDFDCPTFEFKITTLSKVIEVAEILLKKVQRLQIRDSGMGFHLVVEFNNMPKQYTDLHFNPFKEGNIYDAYKEVAIYFKEHFCEFIDEKIYDSRRVLKVPGSLAVYGDREIECAILYDSLYKDLNTFKHGVDI